MDEQVFVRLENGRIVQIQNLHGQSSSYVIQEPIDNIVRTEDEVQEDVPVPILVDEDNDSNITQPTDKVVYIVNQEGTNLEGMQFTVLGNDNSDGQTITLQTLESGDNMVNFTDIPNSLVTPQTALPSEQDLSAIEALSRVVVSEFDNTQSLTVNDINQIVSGEGTVEPSNTVESEQVDSSIYENINFSFYCQECGMTCKKLDDWKQHLYDVHGILQVEESPDNDNTVALLPSCSVCSKTFVDDNELNEHLKNSSCGNEENIPADVNDENEDDNISESVTYKCQYCTEKFTSREKLKDHIENTHPGKPLLEGSNSNMFTKCPYCHKMYVHRGVNKALINHILTAHADKHPPDDSTSEESIACKFCGAEFFWKKSLIRHMKEVHPDEVNAEGDAIFDEIGLQEVQFPRRRVRRSIKDVNSQEMVILKCPICPKTFIWEKSLKRHMVSAHKEDCEETEMKGSAKEVYKCPHCSQVSKYACSVRKHLERKHKSLVKNIDLNKMKIPKVLAAGVEVKKIDQRPVEVRLNMCRRIYRCPFCNYATQQPSNLTRHLTSRTHGHIFTAAEIKAMGLRTFRVFNKSNVSDTNLDTVEETVKSTLPKLKMKRRALDIVLRKFEILKQRNSTDKENTKEAQRNDYSELDIENIVIAADDDSDDGFDEDGDNDDDYIDVVEVGDNENDDVNDDGEVKSAAVDDDNNDKIGNTEGDGNDNTDKDSRIENVSKKVDSHKDKLTEIGNVENHDVLEAWKAGQDPEEWTVKCIECDKVFKDYDIFKKHLHFHVNLKVNFYCSECKENFPLLKDIQKHLRRKHSLKSSEMEVRYVTMTRVEIDKKPLVTYDCPYCDVLFSQSGPLYKHIVYDHSDCIDSSRIKSEKGLSNVSQKQIVITSYRCQFCECSYHRITDIVKHMGLIHADVVKVSKRDSSVRKSGRKRKVPKWLEDEIEFTPASKKTRDYEELEIDDNNDDDYNDYGEYDNDDEWRAPNISPRKKTRKTKDGAMVNKKDKIIGKETKSANEETKNETNVTSEENSGNASVVRTAENEENNETVARAVSESGLTESSVATGQKSESPKKPKPPKKKVSKVKAVPEISVTEVIPSMHKCPHCNFTAKRSSALTFHINFNHAKIKEEPNDTSDDYGIMRQNSILTNQITERTNVLSAVNEQQIVNTFENIDDAAIDHDDDDVDYNIEDVDYNIEDIEFGDSDDDYAPTVDNEGTSVAFSVKLGCPYCEDEFFPTLAFVREHINKQHPESIESFNIADVKTRVDVDPENSKQQVNDKNESENQVAEKQEKGVVVKFTSIGQKSNSFDESTENLQSGASKDNKHIYVCSYCSSQYTKAENAVKHVYQCHSDKEQVMIFVEPWNELTDGYQCPFCNLKSRYKRCVVRHVKRIHKKENFNERQIIVIGSHSYKNETMYKCSLCLYHSNSLRNIDYHLSKMHPFEEGKVNVSSTGSSNLDYLLQHEDSTDYIKCSICDSVFQSEEIAVSHFKDEHEGYADVSFEPVTADDCLDDTMVYKCPICTQSSRWLIAVVRHMKLSHEEMNEYQIEKCKVDLIPYSDDNLAFRCDACNTVFNSRRGVFQHSMAMHGKVLPYSVESSQAGNTPDELYCCPHCEYKANDKQSIVSHSSTAHPKLRKIKKSNIVRVRERNTSDTGGYRCPYCNIVNRWRKSIIRHIRTFHVGQPYDVDIPYESNVNLVTNGNNARRSSKIINCLLCGTTRRSIKLMRKHFQEKHRKHVKNLLNKEFTKFVYTNEVPRTDEMSAGSNTSIGSVRVTAATNDGKTLDNCCVLCGAKYVWKKSLLVHIKSQHKDMYEVYQTMEQVLDIVCQATEDMQMKMPAENIVENVVSTSNIIESNPIMIETTSIIQETNPKIKEITPKIRETTQNIVNSTSKIVNKPVPSQALKKKEKRCVHCQKTLKSSISARIHMKLHHNTTRFYRYSCNLCCLSFPSTIRLHVHRLMYHKYTKCGSWKCPGCNIKYKYWSLLQSHFMREHAQKHIFPIDFGVHQCEMCSKVFSSSQFLRQHLVMHRRVKKPLLKCSACQDLFRSRVDLDIHIEHRHPDMTEICEVCGDMFTKRNLRAHVKTHTDPHLVVSCPFCNKSMVEKSYNRHIINFHSDLDNCSCEICTSDTNTRPEGSHTCEICLKNTCHPSTLYVHKRYNHAESVASKLFQCELCPDKTFASKHLHDAHCHRYHKREFRQTLRAHLSPRNVLGDDRTTHVIHIGQDEGKQFLPKLSETSMNAVLKELIVFERGAKNPHKCLLCGRSFSKLKYIKLHVRRAHVRDEDQPYRCKVCGSGFVRLTEFRKHTRSHSDFRPYKCNYCDKAFKQQANLTDHYRTHTTTKSYQCFICKTLFKQRGGLTSHVIFHDTLKPYKCMYCNKGYTTRGDLSRHMQKYNRDADDLTKSYQCHICEESFPHYPLLMKHIELHSPELPFQCQMCKTSFSSYVTMYFHKVEQGHFLQEEIEKGMNDLNDRARKFRGRKSDLTVEDYGKNVDVSDIQGDIIYVNQDGTLHGDSGTHPGEIIIENFGKERVIHVQESGPGQEELLSIAKQLTELSGFTETEVRTTSKKTLHHEENEIIKHMLDADEDVLASLNKVKTYNHGAADGRCSESQLDETNMIAYKDTYTEEILDNVGQDVQQEEPNVLYGTQNLPATMEELVSIVTQNVPNDGQERVMAYQIEDGSTIYVCLPDSNDPNNPKDLILEQNIAEEEFVAEEVNVVMQDGAAEMNGEDVRGNVETEGDNDNEVCDMEEGSYQVKAVEVFNESQDDLESGGTVVDQGDENNHVEYVHIKVEDPASNNDITSSEINMLQNNLPGKNSNLQAAARNESKEYTEMEAEVAMTTEVAVTPKNDVVTDNSTMIKVLPVEMDNQYEKAEDVSQVAYTDTEQVNKQFDDVGEPTTNTVEESREALLRRSHLAQHLIGNIPLSTVGSAGSTHMIFSGEGLQSVTNIVSNVYDTTEAQHTENTSHGMIDIATAASMMGNVNKSGISCSGVLEAPPNDLVTQPNDIHVQIVGEPETSQSVVEFEIDEARFIKEELLDSAFTKSHEVNDSTKPASGSEVMLVTDNIYTYIQAEKKFICLHCGQKIGSFKNLKSHIRRHAPESSRIHKCSYCEKRFITKSEWKRHMWTHTGERNYECKFCGKKFIQPSHLTEHVRLHTGKKPYHCNVCNRAFNTQSQVKLHWTRIHSSNEVPCTMCDRVFRNKIDLARHKGMEHSDLKKETKAEKAEATGGDHICDICGMAFVKKNMLKSHLERHNLENDPNVEQERYKCEVCGSLFRSKYYAAEHMKSAHGGEKDEICPTCGMAFYTKAMLRRHNDSMHSETGPKWVCKLCDKPFASKTALAYHVGSKH
ncbi:hypothetical protein ACF0H5_008872 [Mactra antiquata]